MTGLELSQKAQRLAQMAPTAQVEIIGSWIWLTFDSKPADAVREALKAEHCHWNQKRKVWQFAGRPSGGSPADKTYLEVKYGAVLVVDGEEVTA